MSLLNGSSNYNEHSYAWDLILDVWRWLLDFVKGLIAERERQATLAVLRSLNDRELRDMGIFRGQINEGLEEAARLRASHQRPSR